MGGKRRSPPGRRIRVRIARKRNDDEDAKEELYSLVTVAEIPEDPQTRPPPMAGIFSSLRRIYLIVYNWILFFGWFQVFYLAVKTLKQSGHQSVYAAVEKPLILAQSAALLEILHSLTGIVRSPVTATLPQEAFGFAPSWLLWLRYSTFLLLYPAGITSEVGLIYNALPYLRESGKYSIRMPNKWNFSFDYYYNALLILGFYVPGSPHLYGYMLGQRKKALSKAKSE
ncbi:hypothetical protein DH2020_029691 [Rehmannia glutinosa]|uniref:Very-long-chain (3R)-3-hydroxyacyl-CoA dehydratase n=1 Tax=Rehmannia glutinosa TaxID=99300 RepID=A0ABR0VMT9_REHGL